MQPSTALSSPILSGWVFEEFLEASSRKHTFLVAPRKFLETSSNMQPWMGLVFFWIMCCSSSLVCPRKFIETSLSGPGLAGWVLSFSMFFEGFFPIFLMFEEFPQACSKTYVFNPVPERSLRVSVHLSIYQCRASTEGRSLLTTSLAAAAFSWTLDGSLGGTCTTLIPCAAVYSVSISLTSPRHRGKRQVTLGLPG